MTRIDSTKVLWRVETKAKTGRWIKRGLYETRESARAMATAWREGYYLDLVGSPLGLGRTRVVRHISGKGRASKEETCCSSPAVSARRS